jgi:hypothetical protein
MGISDFGQAKRARLELVFSNVLARGKAEAQIEAAENPCCAWISRVETRMEVVRSERGEVL